jgi:hypothetical protein
VVNMITGIILASLAQYAEFTPSFWMVARTTEVNLTYEDVSGFGDIHVSARLNSQGSSFCKLEVRVSGEDVEIPREVLAKVAEPDLNSIQVRYIPGNTVTLYVVFNAYAGDNFSEAIMSISHGEFDSLTIGDAAYQNGP